MNTESLSKQHGRTASSTFLNHSNPSIKDFKCHLELMSTTVRMCILWSYCRNWKNRFVVTTYLSSLDSL